MSGDLEFIQAAVLDWFDGVTEAVATDGSERSFHVALVGDPPISDASVFRVRRLNDGALRGLRNAAGEPSAPAIWIVPPDALSDRDLQSALAPCGEPILGFAQTAQILGARLHVLWVPAASVDQLDDEHGQRLRERLNRLASAPTD